MISLLPVNSFLQQNYVKTCLARNPLCRHLVCNIGNLFDNLLIHIAIIFHYELIQSLEAKIILKHLGTSQVNTRLDKTANWSTSPLGMLVSEENPSLRVLMKVFQSHSSEWMDVVM